VMLIRGSDVDEMNRIYKTYFADGKYPARTTVVVGGTAQSGLPSGNRM
jgi:enamine deaminase RidA (YjgF/YER057c/UK114 family)